jgi:hypothetical protein
MNARVKRLTARLGARLQMYELECKCTSKIARLQA